MPDKLKILVKFYIHSITDFGIHAVTYKSPSASGINSDTPSTYFHTSDHFNSQSLWMPIVAGSLLQPVNWSFKYIVPSAYTVVASGFLYIKQVE
jgi:hypothetical protein